MLGRAVTPLQGCQFGISFGVEQKSCMPEGGWRYVGTYLQMRACIFSDIRNSFY